LGFISVGEIIAKNHKEEEGGIVCSASSYHAVLAVKDECGDALAAVPAVFDP
jgi:hypothetical protein